MTGPIMTIGKNLAGLSLHKDRQQLITRLYPRGSGSAPSELGLNNPQYWPAAQELVFDHADDTYAYFTLPNPYSTYYGGWKNQDYGDGWPINSTYFIGKGLSTMFNLPAVKATPSNGVFVQTLYTSNMASAQLFYNWVSGLPYAPARVYDVALNLQRIIHGNGVQWETQPRFIVGLYNTKPSANVSGGLVVQGAGYRVPYQGPLCWCYGNLLSIAKDAPQWYHFPMQTNKYPVGWYAIVIQPYPTSNKGWTIDQSSGNYDTLLITGSPAQTALGTYAEWSATGVTPKGWGMSGSSTGSGNSSTYTGSPYDWQLAFQLRTITTDVTSQFLQGSNSQPGRWVKCPVADYDYSQPYIFHYRHSEYLTDWDAIEKYGLYEGTLKDDACTTQAALLASGTQYLQAMSQPSMTVALSAADLYDLDPDANWAEELYVGAPVMVIDEVLSLEMQCVVTKIDKQDLTNSHVIDTLNLNNVHLSAQKLMAQLAKTHKRVQNYQQGQTVETPFTTNGPASASAPITLTFSIRDITTLSQATRLTVDCPDTFTMVIDGNTI